MPKKKKKILPNNNTVSFIFVRPQRPEPGVFDKQIPPPKPLPYQCHWTPDKRTYVAIQPLPNRGAMVYMAVAEKPELGWDFPAKDQ